MGLRAQKASSSVDIFMVPSIWNPLGVCYCDGAWLWHIHSHLPQGLVSEPEVPLVGPGLSGWVEATRSSNTVLCRTFVAWPSGRSWPVSSSCKFLLSGARSVYWAAWPCLAVLYLRT